MAEEKGEAMEPTTRDGVRDLAERLRTEYSGALPAGQVLTLVFRTASSVSRVPGLTPDVRLELCEVAARRALTDRIAASTGSVPV